MNILTVADYYLPGFKGGGPIRSIENMVAWLGDEFAFHILTRNHDLGDVTPYPLIRSGQWQPVGKAQVMYLTPEQMSITALRKLLHDADYDLLYINSFFSTLSIKLMGLYHLRQIPRTPLLLAPRGEFSPGALALKATKKRVFISLARFSQMLNGVHWQASTADEQAAIQAAIPAAQQIHIAPNMRPPVPQFTPEPVQKAPDSPLKIVFVSRISPKKNLDYALERLTKVSITVQFDIYGPIEDEVYWQKCRQLIERLPTHIGADYRGPVRPDAILKTFSQYHLFFFPTRGENFGHVIWEALFAGCPVLISDQTPWHDLESAGVGWAIPLNQPERFVEIIEQMAQMDSATFNTMAQTTHAYGRESAGDDNVLQTNREMLLRVLGRQ